MSLDPRLLRSFVVLADELHFSKAATRLHMTQPALSQQIRRLELQLGVDVFERTRSSVRLSEGGRAILGPARNAVEAAQGVEETAVAVARGERGELRLGFSPGLHYVAQAVLAEAGRRLPAVRTRARQDSSGALAREVAECELELALGFCAEPRSGIVCERLLVEAAVLASGQDTGWRRGGARSASASFAARRSRWWTRATVLATTVRWRLAAGKRASGRAWSRIPTARWRGRRPSGWTAASA